MLAFSVLSLILPLLWTTFVAGWPLLWNRESPSVCNGRPELCRRRYSNITFIGAHNSYAFSEDPLALSRNQRINVSQQLDLGVRLLQAQAHVDDGELHFCHTIFLGCSLLDGGTVEDYLKIVKSFLDAHPTEVLTLIFTNPEEQSVKDVWEPIFDKVGLDSMAFVPDNVPLRYDEWPTLGEMINAGKRLVVFLDSGANTTEVPFILPQFEMVTVIALLLGLTHEAVQRPLLPMDHLYMINHSLNTNVFPIPGGAGVIVPNVFEAETTNGVKSIMDNVRGCAPFAMDKNPNFILLDWVDEGEAFLAADQLNGFTSPSQSAPATGGETNNAPARSRHGPWLAILTLGFGVLALGS
uniref:PLC-like phosphodiesterase n=1 Tax=Moniliophthora roreri TaxID=221103 RepID=A0A0W0EUB4_MONRR